MTEWSFFKGEGIQYVVYIMSPSLDFVIYLILSIIFILVMRFIHEPLAWILRATLISRMHIDFNKLID